MPSRLRALWIVGLASTAFVGAPAGLARALSTEQGANAPIRSARAGLEPPAFVLPEEPEVIVDLGGADTPKSASAPMSDAVARSDGALDPAKSDVAKSDVGKNDAPVATGAPAPRIEERRATAALEPGKADIPAVAAPAASPAAPIVPNVEGAQPPQSPPAINVAIKDALESLARAPAQRASEARKQVETLAAFYAARDYAPIWLAQGEWTDAAKGAFARLQRAAEDGLDLRDYKVYSLDKGADASLAQGELALSGAVAAYARQASGARIDPARISHLIGARPEVVETAKALEDTSRAADADAFLQGYNPAHPGYLALRAKLAEIRARTTPSAAREIIATEPPLKPGARDPRVPLVRARFGLDMGADPADSALYDTKIAAAVADFQRVNGLPPSGVLTPRTLAALSGMRPSSLEAEIIANMERWRWLPRDIGVDRIEVNLPEFEVRLTRAGQAVYQTRVVVGKPNTPTPIFSNKMQYLIVNPSWNVPQSIIKKEMAPKAAQDPGYFQPAGISSYVQTRPDDGPSAARRDATRWAVSNSCSPTTTRSICTIRRRAACSPRPGARSRTVACASTSLSPSPRRCLAATMAGPRRACAI